MSDKLRKTDIVRRIENGSVKLYFDNFVFKIRREVTECATAVVSSSRVELFGSALEAID